MVDKFLAWINVRLLLLDAQVDKLEDGKRRHDAYVQIHELKVIRDSYNRINGGANE